MRRLLTVLCAVVLCAGCFRATTTIHVKTDGSGTIDQEVGVSPQARAMISNMAAQKGAEAGASGLQMDVFGEEQARKVADQMGVRFVSGEPFKTAGAEGYRAHYAFDDIRKVQVNVDETATAGAKGPAAQAPFAFDFARSGATSVLTIRMPDQKSGMPAGLPQLPGATGNSPQENAQALAMMATMMRGLFVDVSLVVDGKVVQSSVPAMTGSKLTLFQLDLDTLLASDGGLQKLQQLRDPGGLKDLPGVRMVTAPVVKIEFAR